MNHTTTTTVADRRHRSWAAKCVPIAVCGLFAATMGQSLFSGTALGSLFGPSGDDQSQQRDTILQQRTEMLDELYDAMPQLRATVANAAGYATFKKTDIHLLMVATGNGYGVQVNNATGRKTYMRVASLGGGFGMGVQDLRVVFIFNDANVMNQFVNQGWQFGTDADASAQYDNVGVSASQTNNANVDFTTGTVAAGASADAGAGAGGGDTAGAGAIAGGPMLIYQFTQSGVSLQATVSGTRYWKDSDLND